MDHQVVLGRNGEFAEGKLAAASRESAPGPDGKPTITMINHRSIPSTTINSETSDASAKHNPISFNSAA